MSILQPATEKSTFRRGQAKKTKIIMVFTVRDASRVGIMLTVLILELCYLLRYPARHGRKSGYPFSLRQVAVYQRFDDVKKTSKWIFVQAPDNLTNELRSSIASAKQKGPPGDTHRRVFTLAEEEWRDYICHLDAELSALVRCDLAH